MYSVIANSELFVTMGALQSQLVQISGRCYRLFQYAFTNRHVSSYVKNVPESLIKNEETSPTQIDIEKCGEKFKHTFRVSRAYFPYIIGSKHSVHKKLQEDTNTVIYVPKSGSDKGIVIIGPDRGAVISARHKIDSIVNTSRSKIRPTHFLSIPFNEGNIMAKYEMFKNHVLENYRETSRGIDRDIFQTTEKLHLTIGVFTLLDDEEQIVASKALERCKETLIDPVVKQYGPIKIQLKGIQCMNDDPAQVRVLYADVTKDAILQKLMNDIAEYFQNAGLMKKERKEENGVKLHVTLMNSWFRVRSIKEKSSRKNVNVTFDATDILNDHKDIVFGEIDLKEIHLSQMCGISKTGYYLPAAKIDL